MLCFVHTVSFFGVTEPQFSATTMDFAPPGWKLQENRSDPQGSDRRGNEDDCRWDSRHEVVKRG